ncbi:hypothetical protein ACHAWF_012731 [Thalassiosira exigua]
MASSTKAAATDSNRPRIASRPTTAPTLTSSGGGSDLIPRRATNKVPAPPRRVVLSSILLLGGTILHWQSSRRLSLLLGASSPPLPSSPRTDDGAVTAPMVRDVEGDVKRGEEEGNEEGKSTAPLFYHVSPGSTGSRTLYHAACKVGIPSVHHWSFCVSKTRGIRGVDPSVVRGLHAHFEVVRLYEMAAHCLHRHDNYVRRRLQNDTSTAAAKGMPELCLTTDLDWWTRDLRRHLAEVVDSGLVGLLDTPYAYVAEQVLESANELRKSPTFLAMTERDPVGWAASRSRNHPLLLCKKEHSPEGLGATEFDVIGCANRALDALGREGGERRPPLRFWDAFRFRPPNKTLVPEFQREMEVQMARFQDLYRPRVAYDPDIFGVLSNATGPVSEKDVERDLRSIVRGKKDDNYGAEEGNKEKRQIRRAWREWSARNQDLRRKKEEALTCRGRFMWDMDEDATYEYYHLPKTCGASDGEDWETESHDDARVVPLLPGKYLGYREHFRKQ